MCKAEKPIGEYNKNRCKRDELQTICRKCSNAKSKFHYEKNPKKHRETVKRRANKIVQWLNDEKSKLSCKKCGASHISFLQFHHINPTRKEISVSLAAAHGWSIKRIKKKFQNVKFFVLIVIRNCTGRKGSRSHSGRATGF
jgi:5-methylcytosine-specific restriction endonuclease McrA